MTSSVPRTPIKFAASYFRAIETLNRLYEKFVGRGVWAATMVKSGVATFILAGSEESKAA